jgi:hypothetical protein
MFTTIDRTFLLLGQERKAAAAQHLKGVNRADLYAIA